LGSGKQALQVWKRATSSKGFDRACLTGRVSTKPAYLQETIIIGVRTPYQGELFISCQ